MGRRLIALGVAVAAILTYTSMYLNSSLPLPEIDLEEWWGPETAKSAQDTSIRPFSVEFSDEMIKSLKSKLKSRSQWTPPLEGVTFEYGFNTQQLEGWLQYWAEKYPFKARAEFLNKFPQFKTNIQGLDIHFIRVTPKVPAGVEVVPLLLLHGWPGSVREFYEAIPLLTAASKDRDFAIEVIVPSLPGYGFSSAAVRPGLGTDKMAVVFRNLMHRLGFKQYYIQGGDWGAHITSIMATFFPKEILGYHSNMPFIITRKAVLYSIIGSIFPSFVLAPELQDRMFPLFKIYSDNLEESGYMHHQATKPDTVGVALSDSPSGLAAYILEKFSTWTNKAHRSSTDGGLTKHFSRDQLIDNIMIYWSTNSITTTMRLYADTFNKRFFSQRIEEMTIVVPTSVVQSKNEMLFSPLVALKSKYLNLINETILDDGGHFLAFQLPDAFSKDVIEAMKNFRKWHKEHKD